MSEKELMLAGKLYFYKDDELDRDSLRAKKIVREFNNTEDDDHEKRIELLQKLFKKFGEGSYTWSNNRR